MSGPIHTVYDRTEPLPNLEPNLEPNRSVRFGGDTEVRPNLFFKKIIICCPDSSVIRRVAYLIIFRDAVYLQERARARWMSKDEDECAHLRLASVGKPKR